MSKLLDKLPDKITYIDPVHGRSLNLGIAAAVVACCYLIATLLEKCS